MIAEKNNANLNHTVLLLVHFEKEYLEARIANCITCIFVVEITPTNVSRML